MALRKLSDLKYLFRPGGTPDGADFGHLLDSIWNLSAHSMSLSAEELSGALRLDLTNTGNFIYDTLSADSISADSLTIDEDVNIQNVLTVSTTVNTTDINVPTNTVYNELEVGTLTLSGNIIPKQDATHSLGTAEDAFSHLFTRILHLGTLTLKERDGSSVTIEEGDNSIVVGELNVSQGSVITIEDDAVMVIVRP